MFACRKTLVVLAVVALFVGGSALATPPGWHGGGGHRGGNHYGWEQIRRHLQDQYQNQYQNQWGHDEDDEDDYEQERPAPPPKPIVAPANKLPKSTLSSTLPRIDERFQAGEGTPPKAVPGGVRIVNPIETGKAVDFEFNGVARHLEAGQGALLAFNDPRISFQSAADAASPTTYRLASGNTYRFSHSGKWNLHRSRARFQFTIDNSDNPFVFNYLLNAHEFAAEPLKVSTRTHADPMWLQFDLGENQGQKKVYQSNISNFKLGKETQDQGETIREVVHETMLKVALGDQNRWVLVDRRDASHIRNPHSSQPDKEELARKQQEQLDREQKELDKQRAELAQRQREEERRRQERELAAAAAADDIRPKLYGLFIGVSKYQDPRYNLSFAHRDAEAMAPVWQQQKGKMYLDVETKVLVDQEATKRNIESALGWLEKKVTRRDHAVILVSGHGMLDTRGRFYFATHDMDDRDLKATCVPRSSLEDTLKDLGDGQALVFLDTCHSGKVGVGDGRKGSFSVDLLKGLPDAGQGVVVFNSSQPSEASLERDIWGHGAFTKAFLDAVNNPSTTDVNGDGYLAINELDFALQERVKNLTDGQQHPSYDKSQSIKTSGRIMRLK